LALLSALKGGMLIPEVAVLHLRDTDNLFLELKQLLEVRVKHFSASYREPESQAELALKDH
jgi:hypothetical protein